MTLAERLIDHCTPANRENGFGSLMGATIPLRDMVAKLFWQRLKIADGVELVIPAGCTWQTFDQSDGSVKFAFNGPLPTITAAKSVLKVNAEISDIVLRIGAAAAEAQVALRHFPDFTLTVPLKGQPD